MAPRLVSSKEKQQGDPSQRPHGGPVQMMGLMVQETAEVTQKFLLAEVLGLPIIPSYVLSPHPVPLRKWADTVQLEGPRRKT